MIRPSLLAALILVVPLKADAQEWRLSTQFGRLTWEGAALSQMNQSSVAVALSRHGLNDWLLLSAGAPLDGGSLWATLGSGRRYAMDAPVGLGLDVSSHLFVQRVTTETVLLPGGPPALRPPPDTTTGHDYLGGAAGQTMGLAFARWRDVRLELRAGVAGTATYVADEFGEDFTPVADGRLLWHFGAVQAGPEAQHWHQRATYAGGTALAGFGPAAVWASLGQWTHGGPTGASWSAGAAVALPAGVRLEATFRDNGFDPLYALPTGRTVAAGASVRLGGRSAYSPPVPARYADGTAVIELRMEDAPGTPRIAGDFNDWQPVPMVANGDSWVISLPLEPGVYHYAFVNENGEWFVPASTPGRQSDGMGGWVAVLIIAE